MIKRYAITLMGMVILFGVISVSLVSADTSASIDFEGLAEGAIVSTLSCGSGITCPNSNFGGSVSVFGHNPSLSGDPNAAMIFDAECVGGCSGRDLDLNFPGHGNTLIISEDLDGNDPDDGDSKGSFFEFDFSDLGPGGVTVNSIDVGDIELNEGEAFVESFVGGCGGSSLGITDLPKTGDHVIQTVVVAISGVDCLLVHLNGSGTIDNINFTMNHQPAIDIEKWTKIGVPSSGDDVCDTLGKPGVFTLRYTGDNILHHSQGDKVKVSGHLNGETLVHITSKKFFDGKVNLGESFDTEKGEVIIKDRNGEVLKEIEFHTSCSAPLVLGDQYGGVQLVGFTSKDGKSATFDPNPDDDFGVDADTPAGPPGHVGDQVTWTYFVTNTGDTPLSNVVVVDDNGTPSDTSDDFTPTFVSGDANGDNRLDLGETWLYQATGRVKSGQYSNIGDVSGDDPDGTTVRDEDPSHHVGVFPAGNICKTLDKPQMLTMLYTGNNILDHSQKDDKVNFSGDPQGASPVHIIAAEKANGSGKKFFDGTINQGEQFVLGKTGKLKSKTFVLILDQNGTRLQTIEFHTSCSQPLELGNQFGGIQLIGFTDKKGNSA